MGNRHDWNSLDQYLNIHGSYIRNYMNLGFVLVDELTMDPTPETARWRGTLFCEGDIQIEVRKFQEINRLPSGIRMVHTVTYSYHVRRVIGSETTNLFRYDNVHIHPGHPDNHHLHRYDSSGADVKPTHHVGEANWPTLSDVIERAQSVWQRLQTGLSPYEATSILL